MILMDRSGGYTLCAQMKRILWRAYIWICEPKVRFLMFGGSRGREPSTIGSSFHLIFPRLTVTMVELDVL